MKKLFIVLAIGTIVASCGNKCNCNGNCENCTCAKSEVAAEESDPLNFTIVNREQSPLAEADADGWITIFNGENLDGWRGYGRDTVPGSWNIDENAIHLIGSGTGEAQEETGGDLLFGHKFKNFELELDYKVSRGGNSGIFYLAQEVTTDKRGKTQYLPIWQSCSEYQILDNDNHEDAKLGIDGNRQAASLYDMIPAVPQNAKPFGEWNTAKIVVYKGTVIHYQNGEKVLEYHLWTPKWEDMLQESKFQEGGEFPIAYLLMKDMGKGKDAAGNEMDGGYIALQDHGDDVWYRNIRIKPLD